MKVNRACPEAVLQERDVLKFYNSDPQKSGLDLSSC